MAVMIQAFADIEILIPSKDLYPLSKHFQGLRTNISYDKKTEYVLLKIAPKKKRMVENLEDLEVLEFLTKNMFVQRAGRWVDTIK